MEYTPESAYGTEVSDDLIAKLGLSADLYKLATEGDPNPFFDEFEKKYGIYPDRVVFFEYERGGYFQGLSGFEYNKWYLLFDDDEEEKVNNCKFPIELEFYSGRWSELG